MSALINRVKDHISDNRGKYGAAAGAGAMYGASKIDSPLVNQAGFNILAKGQNLALDTAAKIDPRATSTLNDLGMHKIRPEDIDASNALYNSGVAKYINPNPVDMVNANEHSTEAYNKAMALKANAEDTLVNAKNQGQDYLDQGINYVKGLNPFSESTIKIPVKDLLLEGYQPEAITEGMISRALGGAALAASLTIPSAIINDGKYAHNVNPVTIQQANNALKNYNGRPTTIYGQKAIDEYYKNLSEVVPTLPKIKPGNNSTFHNNLLKHYEDNNYNADKNKPFKPLGDAEVRSAAAHQLGHDSLGNAASAGLLGAALGALGANGRRRALNMVGKTTRRVGTFIERKTR